MNTDEIADILGEYDLGALRQARPFDPDARRPWKITTDTGDFAVRECLLNTCPADLEFEHGLASWLSEHGFPASEPLPTRGGRTWCERNGRLFAIYTLIPGEHFTPGNAAQARSAGAALAEFHEIASSFPAARRKALATGYRSSHDHAEYLMARRSDRPEVEQLAAAFRELDEGLRSHALDECLLFNDFRPENVLFVRENFSGAFDLDCCCWGARLAEVAKSVLGFALTLEAEQGRPSRPVLSLACARCFLRGYLERRPISLSELELLPMGLRREVRACALFDLSDVERHRHRWVEDEWLLSKQQIDLIDAECESCLEGAT